MNIPDSWKAGELTCYLVKTIVLDGEDFVISKFWFEEAKRFVYDINTEQYVKAVLNIGIYNA